MDEATASVDMNGSGPLRTKGRAPKSRTAGRASGREGGCGADWGRGSHRAPRARQYEFHRDAAELPAALLHDGRQRAPDRHRMRAPWVQAPAGHRWGAAHVPQHGLSRPFRHPPPRAFPEFGLLHHIAGRSASSCFEPRRNGALQPRAAGQFRRCGHGPGRRDVLGMLSIRRGGVARGWVSKLLRRRGGGCLCGSQRQ